MPLPGGNLGLMCGKPCGGRIPLGPDLIGGPRGPIPLGPAIGPIISGGGPRLLGPKSGGGPIGRIMALGLGGSIRGRIGPNIGPIGCGGGGILIGIPGGIGSLPNRGGGGRMPTRGILGPMSGPLFNGLIFNT